MLPDKDVAQRLRLRDLHMLRVVGEERSMARAARILAVSQPAISKAIAEMERLLGAPLLDRSAQGVALTPAGEVLLARGTVVFDELQQGIEEIRALEDPAQGHLRIGTTEPLTAIVSIVIAELIDLYPRMRFEVAVADSASLLARLRERQIDLAITRTAASDAEADLLAEPLFHDPLVVMAGRRHRLARRKRLNLAELSGEAWTLSPPEMFLGRFVTEAFRVQGLDPPRPVVTAPTVVMRVGLLRTGRFLSILPSAMLRFPQQYPGLIALPVDLVGTRRPIALVSLPNRRPAPALRIFRDHVLAAARKASLP